MLHRNLRSSAIAVFAAASAAAVLSVTAHAETDWSFWSALPDHYQGAVDLRSREAGKKGKVTTEVQLRDRYAEKVTVSLRLIGTDSDGKTQEVEKTVSLAPGEPKGDDSLLKLDVASLETAAVVKIAFDGPAPAPTAGGFSYAAANLSNARENLAVIQDTLTKTEKAQHDAQTVANDVRQTSTESPDTGKQAITGVDVVGAAGVGDVSVAQSNADRLKESLARLLDARKALETQIKEGEAAAAQPVPTNASATPVAANVKTAAPGGGGVAAASAAAGTEQKVSIKDLMDQAEKAAKASDWPKVETTLKTLQASEAYQKQKDNFKASIDFNLGSAYGHEKKYPEAEAALRSAVALDPKNASYEDVLGIALANQGKLTEAQTAFEAAAKIEPDNAAYQAHLKTIKDAIKNSGK